MIAKQITNDTVAPSGQRNIAGALIGDPTKSSVKLVSKKFRINLCAMRVFDKLLTVKNEPNDIENIYRLAV